MSDHPTKTATKTATRTATTTTNARQAVGRYGERLAARYLSERGYQVLDRNWRCREGELDIVARSGETLVFCEVKTRRSMVFGGPLIAVDQRKQQRLRRLAIAWLSAHDEHADEIRIDVIGIEVRDDGPARLEHLPGVM